MEYLAVYASDQEGQEEEQGEDGGGDGGGSVDEPPALPRAVREMFGEDTVENSGREHDRRSGMWPAHIYIPVDGCDGLQHLAKRARLRFSRAVEAVASAPRHPHKRSRRECDSSYSPIPIDSIDDLHVSLSHNLKLRGHELDPLATSLRQALCGAGGKKGFRIEISSSFDVMVNGERDRSFCSLKVVGGKERILNIIDIVNRVLKRFQQPSFYDEPHHHVSVASVAGDMQSDLKTELEGLPEEEETEVFDVTTIEMRSGTRKFILELS